MPLLERFAPTLPHPLARSDDIVDLTEQGLSAVYGFREGESFVVRDGAVVLIDQSTGRLMPDRRWSYGLHQMIEIATDLAPTPEAQTVAQITQQTYFPPVPHFGGPNRNSAGMSPRTLGDLSNSCAPDFSTRAYKIAWAGGFVCLVWLFKNGPTSCSKLSSLPKSALFLLGLTMLLKHKYLLMSLRRVAVKWLSLDALAEAQEADLVGVAGQQGAITIATHLAGRGTDIALADETRTAGGLHVMICSLMASGRLERQLYGRAGRQGDPGSYETVVSLEDRGLVDGAQSLWRRTMTLWLNLRLLPRWSFDADTNQSRRTRP